MTTVFVTVTDQAYFKKAKRTIEDLRTRGEWRGDIVLICVDFLPSQTFLDFYRVEPFMVPHINVSHLIEQWKHHPIRPMADQRHTKKLAQWNKLYVFDVWFKQWSRVVFLDAGLRVLDSVHHLLEIPGWEGRFMAPDDTQPGDNGNRFGIQLDLEANPPVTELIKDRFGEHILHEKYFMNCIWMYDTSILDVCTRRDLESAMNQYPICLTNEMGIMNLLLAFRHRLWTPFPEKTIDGKYLYGWCESNYKSGTTWRDFCFIKYPITISMDCE